MASFIEEFYYGNLDPQARSTKENKTVQKQMEVLMLNEDYQYVLVGGSSDKYLWILSRTPKLDDATKTLILAEAERRGYDTNRLIWVKQK